MGGVCSTYRGEVRWIQGFGEGKLKESDYFGDLSVGWRIILKWIFK